MDGWFIEIFGGGAFSDVYDMLNVSLLGEDGKYANASGFAEAVYHNVMVPLALTLLVIFLVCSLVEKSTNEQFTYEQMFLLLAKTIVAVFIIDKGFYLMMEFQKAGLDILHQLSNVAKEHGLAVANGSGKALIDNSEELQALYKYYTGAEWPDSPGLFDTIGAILSHGFTMLLAYVATLVIKICVSVIIFMRVLEVYLRTIFAPISLVDVFHNGLNSNGFRFLKGYLAVSLQVVAIYGCTLLNSVLAADISITNGSGAFADTTYIFKYLGLSMATIGILFKSQSLIKEFVGTN